MADIPPASTWGNLQSGTSVQAGYYGSQDLEATREWLHSKGVVAKPSLDHRGKLCRLRAACDKGQCVVFKEDNVLCPEKTMCCV